MSLTLYWNVASQPARAVKCLLDIAKVPHNAISVDISNNETRTKEYLLKNPLGQIPFLTDGGFKLAESNAILVYLCEKYPVIGKYYGSSINQRAAVNQHLSWYQNSFRPALFKTIFLKIYEGVKRQQPVYRAALQAAELEMDQAMAQLERQLELGKGQFVAGEEVSIADLQYFFEITNYIVYERSFSHFKLISQWFARMLTLPEVREIHEQWQKVAPGVTKTLNSVNVIQSAKL